MTGLSATICTKEKIWEEEALIRQKYELLDSKISGMLDFHSVTEKVSVRKFMEKSEGYAKLIFCSEPSDFPADFVATKTNCRDIERIRRLKASDIFLISEPELARAGPQVRGWHQRHFVARNGRVLKRQGIYSASRPRW